MLVKLTYFRLGGKFACEGEYETDKQLLFEIHGEVQERIEAGRLPGLIAGLSKYIVSVDVPEHPHNHPRLVMAEGLRCHLQDVEKSEVPVAFYATRFADGSKALNGE